MIRLAIRQSRQGPGRIPRRPGSGRNLVRRLLPATFTLLVVAPSAAAAQWPNQEEHAAWVRESYRKTEQMVAMRDGTRLFTIVYQPVDTSRTYPVMLFRTPYSIGPYGPDEYREVLGPSPEFDGAGYIFVFQDVRGQFQSEGEFEVIKPLATSEELAGGATDESTDNYDTIEWVLANVAGHNGRVGQWYFVPGVADGDGDGALASGAGRRIAAGLAGGHVHRRRLAPQRRVPDHVRVQLAGRQRAAQG